jgi:hypothetical protein
MPMTPEEITRLTKRLSLTALATGSLIIGKRYYENWQLTNWIINTNKEINSRYDNYFTIDKLIPFIRIDNGLLYNFKNTRLTLTKNYNPNKITYSFETPDRIVELKTNTIKSKELK